MSKLMESSEFGDWLMEEIARAGLQSKSAPSAQSLAAGLRLESLKVTRKVLLEFLTVQQKMMDAASAARRRNPPTRLQAHQADFHAQLRPNGNGLRKSAQDSAHMT